MFYKKILQSLIPLFDLNVEERKLYRPEGVTYWGFSDYADEVYEVYVSISVKDHHGSFGYWVHDEECDMAYKKALKKLFSHVKWSYKIRLGRWLR